MMTVDLPWAHLIGSVTVAMAAGGVLGWLVGPRRRVGHARDLIGPPPPPEFRRPAEFGPLLLPWDQMERIRVAIFADQLGPSDDAWKLVEARGWIGELRSTPEYGRVEGPERVLHWLQHWTDDVVALTGRGVPA